MATKLEDFCGFCRASLKSGVPLGEALPAMADNLCSLLANPDFVSGSFKPEDDFSKKVLHHDQETGFYVLAHVHQGPKEGPPHSHGASWAIYGTALGVTGMKEWQRTNPSSDEAVELRMASHYDLGPGQTRAYGPHTIHSTIHPAKAWVIRVTGSNLDVEPRYRFDRKRDRIVETA